MIQKVLGCRSLEWACNLPRSSPCDSSDMANSNVDECLTRITQLENRVSDIENNYGKIKHRLKWLF